jgi:hypothetical protein
MIFRVTMKDPDGVGNAIMDAVQDEVGPGVRDAALQEALNDAAHEKILEAIDEWFDYSRYLTVEIDTELGTCKVIT